MQTFLPYPNFAMCARVLDDERLERQIMEAKQILDILTGKTESKYWINRPPVRMWKGYTHLLRHYINAMITEWQLRDHENSIAYEKAGDTYSVPPWIFDKRLAYSHRVNLVRMNPDHYGKRWKIKDVNAPYWWPVQLRNKRQHTKMENYWDKRLKKIERRRKKNAIHKTNR